MNRLEKKNKIAESAMELFAEKGYSNTKIIDIANRSGIGKGTVYEYYTSKEEILFSAINKHILDKYKSLDSIQETDSSPEESLKAFIMLQLSFLNKPKISIENFISEIDFKNFKCAEFTNMIAKTLLIEFKLLHKIICRCIEQGFFKDIDPTLATYYVIGVTHALVPMLHTYEKINLYKDTLYLEEDFPDDLLNSFQAISNLSCEDIYSCIVNGINGIPPTQNKL